MRPDDRCSRQRDARSMRRVGPAIGMLLALLPAVLSQLAVSGCVADPPAHPAASLHAAEQPLFVIKRGWHLDIGIAVAALTAPLQRVEAALPGERYLLFGFGDRRYLTARNQRLDALMAAVRPGAALVLLTGLRDTPQQAFGTGAVRTLRVDAAQMQAIQAFIWETLLRVDDQPLRVQSGPYPESTYLAAVPRYSGLHTCNSWAAEALRAGGLPAHRWGVIFAWQLWIQLPRLQRAAP